MHETANRGRCAGAYYVEGKMLLVRTTEAAGVISLEKKGGSRDVF